MRVNLQDFHSYRRARRGSHSEGSDTESVHSCRGGRDKNGENNEDTRLFISEWNDRPFESSKKNSLSLPGTPGITRKGCKDAAVSCRVVTRDVGVSYVAPRSRSIGTLTDKVEELNNKDSDKKREVKAKPCLQCFRRNQKTFESRSVGTTSPKHDSGHLSVSSLSSESIGPDELEAKLQDLDTNSKNVLLHKLGKKSPIISRLSSPQLFPPTLTFDNSTNTEPIRQRDQRLNTFLRMDDLFSREELNELIDDAKKQWETTNRSRFPKLPTKPITSDRGTQTLTDESLRTKKPSLLNSVGISVKPSTRDVGIGYSSINVIEKKVSGPKVKSVACGEDFPFAENKTPVPKTRNVACGEDVPVIEKKPSVSKSRSVLCGEDIPIPGRLKSVGVGDHKFVEECIDCAKRKLNYHVRSVGCGDGRLSDILCERCKNLQLKSVGVGDSKITDETCDKCKYKRTSNFSCQVKPFTRSETVQVSIPIPSRETSVATTPEVERRPFGSPGVKICDKCHDAITSVAKDFVGISGPSPTGAIINQSKIPRLVDYQKPEEKSPPKPLAEIVPVLPPPKNQTLELPLKTEKQQQQQQQQQQHPVVVEIKSVDPVPPSTSLSLKPEKSPSSSSSSFKTEEKLILKTKNETVSSSSSIVSSSIPSSIPSSLPPSITSSPQVKRVPYNRQDTYTKLGSGVGGFVNPAFEELLDSKQVDNKDKAKASTPPIKRKDTPEKPKREKFVRKKMEKPKEIEKTGENDAIIKGRKERKSSSSSSSSSEDEDATSVITSSVIAEEPEPPSLGASSDTINAPRKKSQPSRGMKAALKVLNDSIGKPVRSGQQLTNAVNIIQREWFKFSSQKDADPHAVEDYMDAFEEYSKGLLHRVVNLSDINGNTAMHYAVSHGNFDVVSVLLDSKVCNINQQNKAGYTATMLVALAQIRNDAHECVVRKLFESGDVNIKASQHGQTALMLAVSHGRLDMVRMLIAAGANPNIQDEDGSTALMCAAEHGHLAIVRYLVAQSDTDLYLMDNDGSTALTIAVEAGHKDVGVLLYKQMNLSRGTSPYSSIRGGKRPRTPTMARSSITPPPRSSAPSSPGRSRKSSGRVSPAHARQNSASLSNLII